MTTATLRKRIVKKIEKLPPKELKILNGFIDTLEEDEEATIELQSMPGFLDEIELAEKEFKNGKGVNWRKIKKDV